MLQVGSFVLYAPTGEVGRIKSLSATQVFVVFRCENNWKEYENYTAAGCPLSTLTVIQDKIFWAIFNSIQSQS